VTDAELVAQVLAGSQDAARRLVEQHQQAVFNLVCRMVRDPGIAEELAQDTFAKAFAALRGFDSQYRLISWLLRIAQNTAIDYLRRRRPPTVSLDDERGGHEIESVLIDACRRGARTWRRHSKRRSIGCARSTGGSSCCGITRTSRTRRSRKCSGSRSERSRATFTGPVMSWLA
jgi:DNA-directed RNA polymerase specialized sigma24 family protein